MSVISMRQLLEAGVHFGHQTRRWNPKMSRYIYTERNGIYIIDLQQTLRKLEEAYDFIRDLSSQNKDVLFVGTKKQASESIKEEAQRVGAHYVNARWLGGMLTNFKTIKGRVKRLEQLRAMESDGTFEYLTKKETAKLKLEIEKLERFIGGIKNMKELPGALFIVDPKKERIAVNEARILGIPTVGIVDTNCDPDEIDYVIPGNDDAIRSIKLISQAISNAILEGKQGQDGDLPIDTSQMESSSVNIDGLKILTEKESGETKDSAKASSGSDTTDSGNNELKDNKEGSQILNTFNKQKEVLKETYLRDKKAVSDGINKLKTIIKKTNDNVKSRYKASKNRFSHLNGVDYKKDDLSTSKVENQNNKTKGNSSYQKQNITETKENNTNNDQ